MLVDIGEFVHVIERRRFDQDLRRHFVGQVERIEPHAMRVTGYAFVYDAGRAGYAKSRELRTRVIGLGTEGIIVNVAPPGTDLDQVRYEVRDGRLVATDGGAFSLDINEFGPNR